MKKLFWKAYHSCSEFLMGKSTNEETRNTWIAKQLKGIPRGCRILDAGAGQLKWKKACAHLNYVSQDFCEYKGKGDGKGMQKGEWDTGGIDLVSDITDIPVEDHSFDVILCSEVFEHISNPELAVREFSRIIKNDGTLLLTAPYASLTHFAPYHFYSGFNRYWFESVLKKYGFEIEESVRNGDYYSWIRQELRRLPEVVKKYSGRRLWLTRLWNVLLSFSLKRCGNAEDESGELLCFGYFIRARKVE